MSLLLADNAIFCVVCEDPNCDVNTVIECVECHKCCHLSCRKLFGTAAAKARQTKYFCSAGCKEMHVMLPNEGKNDELKNMMLAQFEAMRKDNEATRLQLSGVVAGVEKSQQFLSDRFDFIMGEMNRVNSQQHHLKRQVDDVEDKCTKLSSTVNSLEEQVDKFNRESLSKNAILLGVPAMKDEDVVQVVKSVAAVVKCSLPDNAIATAKRIRESKAEGRYAPIQVVFSSEEHKEKLFALKRGFGLLKASSLGPAYAASTGRIIVRDEMTPHGLSLLNEIRDLQETMHIKHVWPGRDGVILVKRTDNSKPEHIRNRNDISNLVIRKSKRALNTSGNSSLEEPGTSGSPPIQQELKKR